MSIYYDSLWPFEFSFGQTRELLGSGVASSECLPCPQHNRSLNAEGRPGPMRASATGIEFKESNGTYKRLVFFSSEQRQDPLLSLHLPNWKIPHLKENKIVTVMKQTK